MIERIRITWLQDSKSKITLNIPFDQKTWDMLLELSKDKGAPKAFDPEEMASRILAAHPGMGNGFSSYRDGLD